MEPPGRRSRPRPAVHRGIRFSATWSILAVAIVLVNLPAIPSPTHPDPTAPRGSGPGARTTPIGAASPTLPTLVATDWPTYLENPERTGASSTESTLAPTNVSGLRSLWTFRTGGVIEDSPIVAGGVVFVAGWDGYEYAVNLTNGTMKWKTFIGQTTFPGCNYNKARGSTASASVVNGSLYVMGGDPYLYALNASNGTVLWKTSELVNNPSAGNYNWGSPLVYGNFAYVGLATACGAPWSQGMLIQVNLSGNHSVLHTFGIVPNGASGGSVWSTPAIDPTTGIVWLTTGDEGLASSGYFRSIVALLASNLSLVGSWKEPTGGGDFDFGAGPTLFHDAQGRALVGAVNKNGLFYTLNRSNVSSGAAWGPIWQDNISWYYNSTSGYQACGCSLSPAAFDGQTLYVGGGFTKLPNGTEFAGSVRAIDPASGAFRWSVGTPGVVRAGLAYADGLVVDSPAANNNVNGWIEVRNASSGNLLYRLALNRSSDGPPSIVDGILLFGVGNLSLGGPGYLRALALPLTNASAAMTPTAAPRSVAFQASVQGGVPGYSFAWAFGDGATAIGRSKVHTYAAPGTYSISLISTDAIGETTNFTTSLLVPDPPIVISSFTANPPRAIVGTNVTFSMTVLGGTGTLRFSYAQLPPGCTSRDLPTFSCVPSLPGSYDILSTVSDYYGSVSIAGAALTVLPAATAPPQIVSFVAAPSPVTEHQTTVLTVTVSGGAPPFAFAYSGLPTGCNSQNRSAIDCTPTGPGTYSIGVNVTDVQGRRTASIVGLAVLPSVAPLVAALTFWVRSVSCLPSGIATSSIQLNGSASGGMAPYSFAWSLPTGDAVGPVVNTTTTWGFSTNATLNVTDALGASRVVAQHLPSPAAPCPPPPPLGTTVPSSGPGPWVVVAGLGVVAAAAAAGAFLLVRQRRRGPPNHAGPGGAP